MKQFLSYFSYGFVMVLLVALALFFRQSFLVMLLVIMMVLPFLSYHMTKSATKGLSIQLTSKSTETLKGQTLPLSLSVKNSTFFPLLNAMVAFQLSSAFYEEGDVIKLVIGAGKTTQKPLQIPVTYSHLGLFTAQVKEAYVWDYLHFFKFDIPCDSHTIVKVFPQKEELTIVNDSLGQEGFDEYETPIKRGNASSDVTDIREYVPGDRLQAIHWKLSAKTGNLMVKEFEATSSHQYVVLLELYKDKDAHVLDQAIANAYNVSCQLLALGELFFFGFYNEALADFSFYKVADDEQLTVALTNAYYARPYSTPNLAFDTYRNSGIKMGSVLCANEQGVFDDLSQKIG